MCSSCKDDKSKNCVCEVVKDILAAQEQVQDNDCCRVSCERSIQQLLNPTSVMTDNNTIPFTLDCACNGTFWATGAMKYNGCFKTVCSPYLRVKKFLDEKGCCAVLEILLPTKNNRPSFPKKHKCCKEDECFDGFVATGICLTVDLEAFSSITCYPPFNVQRLANRHKSLKCK